MAKIIQGYIYSAGEAKSGLIPFFKAPDYYLLEVEKNRTKTFTMDEPPRKYPRLPMVKDGNDGFLTAGIVEEGEVSEAAAVAKYQRSKGKGKSNDYEIKELETFTTDFGTPRVTNMKRLQSGAIIMCWYKETWGTPIRYPCFSYRNLKGRWLTLETSWDNLSTGAPRVSADFAQDSLGGLWYFGQGDSNKNIAAIHLTDLDGNDLRLDFVEPEFINKYMGDLGNEGENPYIVTDLFGDRLILAYQNRYYKSFSTSPFRKGAKINVVEIDPYGRKTLLYMTEDYVERVSPFALVGDSIVYAPIDLETHANNDLYLLNPDGVKTFITTSKYPMLLRYTDEKLFCNGFENNVIVAGL